LWILHDGVIIRPVLDFSEKSSSELEVFTMYDMYLVLKNISKEDIELMGLDCMYAHPLSLLWQILPVPSNPVRPNHIGHSGINQSVKEDDMTSHLKRITKFNTKLAELLVKHNQKNVPIHMYVRYNGDLIADSSDVYDAYVQLYTNIGNYQTSKIKVNVSQYGRKFKSLHDLWLNSNNKHSRNRIKNDVVGKRMQFAARAVLCPEESMHIHDVRIPKDMAMKLTTNEVVTRYNISVLTDRIRRGTHMYPGANYLFRAGNSCDIISLDSENRFSLELCLGDVVERHAIDGDIVLMIRQPTLHKFSFMAHRVIVDFTLNNNTIAIHPAVTTCYNADFDGDEMNLMMVQSSEAKVEALMLMLVDYNIMKDDVPIVTFTQNSVVAAYIMTSDHTFVSRDSILRLAYAINTSLTGSIPDQLTGKECFSRLLLPRTFNMSIGSIVIRDGLMISGQWTKKLLNCHGGLIHSYYMHYGAIECANFITRMYRCMDWYIQYIRGLTVCIDDCMVTNDVLQIPSLKNAVNAYLDRFPDHRPDRLETLQNIQQEKDICKVLDTIREITSNRGIKYLKSKAPNSNGLLALTESGSKGSMTNVTQIVSTVGQQRNYQSKRYPSVSYHKYDHSAKHGMIFNSFTAGMSVPENYSQLRSGRSGLIETAVNTSETGYSHKRMAKSMEDIVIDEYGQVINTYGQILQLNYGSDGFSPSYLYRVQLKTLTIPKTEIMKLYDSETAELILEIRHELLYGVQITDDSYLTVHTPFKLIDCGYNSVTLSDKIKVWNSLLVCKSLKLKLYFFETKFDFNNDILTYIYNSCLRARVPVGDSVGEHAAQSIGEPTTQITLNSFHSSGDASNLSTGVPRIKEIINATKDIQTPSMRIYLTHGDYNDHIKFGDMLVERLFETKVIGNVITDRNIIYTNHKIMNRVDMFRQNIELNTYKQILENFLFQSPDVSAALFYVDNMTKDIAIKLDNTFHSSMNLCFVYDTDFVLVLFDSNYFDLKNDRVHTLYMVIDHVLKVRISGVSKIHDYEISQSKQYRIDEETGISKWVDTLSIVTLGSNIVSVMNIPNVDTYRTYSNDIMESEQTFGILGSSSLILSELTNVLAANGASVANRHISLMADRMTSMGIILSTLYNGICTDGTSALRNMTFENTPVGMITGALHAQHDPCNGPFECIILNHKIRAGTGIVNLLARDDIKTYDYPTNIDKCLIILPNDKFFMKFTTEHKIYTENSETSSLFIKVTVPKSLKREKRKHTEIHNDDTENRKRRLSINSFCTQSLSKFPYKFEQIFVPSSPIDEISFFDSPDNKVFKPFEV
jgi:DNA-directed RNA polymerase beta' subunit